MAPPETMQGTAAETTSARASTAIASLTREHERVAQLLRVLEAEVGRVLHGAEPDLERMSSVLEQMTDYLERYHHPREEVMIRLLQRRAPGLPAIVAELEREHETLLDAGERLRHELERAAADTPVPRRSFDEDGLAYASELRRHMMIEESTLFPLAARTLDDEDWGEVIAALDRGSMM